MKYKVKKGDTLWDIWKRFGYSKKYSWTEFQEAFRKLNEGRDPSLIRAGETINLPDPPGTLMKIASERPEMFAIGSFTLGALFMVGVLWLTKKLKL